MTQQSKSAAGGSTDRWSFRFSPRTRRLITVMAARASLNRTAWIEATVTQLARDQGIDVDSMQNTLTPSERAIFERRIATGKGGDADGNEAGE